MSLTNLKTVINDLNNANDLKAEIRVVGTGDVIQSVPIRSGASHTFVLVGLGVQLVLDWGKYLTTDIEFDRNPGVNETFYVSNYFVPLHDGSFSIAPAKPADWPQPTLTGLKTVINDLEGITITAAVGWEHGHSVEEGTRTEVKPGESHTIDLGRPGVPERQVVLSKPGDFIPTYIPLTHGNQIIYTTKVFGVNPK